MTDLAQLLTADLLAEVIAQAAGSRVVVGPMPAGPGGVATALAEGALRRPVVRRLPGEALAYEALIPVTLELTVDVPTGRQRYTVECGVPVRVDAHVEDGHCVVELPRLRSREVRTRLQAHGLQARLFAKVGDVEGEVRREVARYVNDRFASPDVAQLLRIPLPS